MSFLELVGLTKRYGARAVVDDVSLSLPRGMLVSLLGPSGCGKTTTLRLIAGFTEPDAGEIRVDGRRIAARGASLPPERRNMAMIFQSYALWPHMTVWQNVVYGLTLRRVARADIRRRGEAILELTRLAGLADRYPGELSGGQQQRVSLARALVVEPEILLLDEPLSNLDANLREEMRAEIRRLHEERGCTTVYVTHDQAEAMSTADAVVVMSDGRIEQIGSPEDVYLRPASEFVARFIGGTNILKGHGAADGFVLIDDGIAIASGGGEVTPGREIAVSIRPHHVRISAATPAPGTVNIVGGTVTRQVFLGPNRAYDVALPGGAVVHVLAEPEPAIARGDNVWLELPPQHCRALPR